MERGAIEGDSPVSEIDFLPSSILSSTEHVKFCVNQPGPSGKAKYSWETDSEQVPWGKGEKNPDEGSETEPETECLQSVGAALAVTAYLLYNGSATYFN